MDFKKRTVFLALLSILLLSACSSSDKDSCKTSFDCEQKKCQVASCEENACSYNPKPNCCGNKLKDASEDGKKGNSCTCPADYGACSGIVKIGEGTRATDAKYVKKQCNSAQECVFGVDEKEIKPLTLLDEYKGTNFELGITSTINQPFRVPTDSFQFKITLKDAKESVIFPIKFTHITLRDGEILYGEKDTDSFLGGIGDSAMISVPMQYRLTLAEEEKRLSYVLDFEYQSKALSNGAETTKTTRDSLENRFTTKILFAQDGIPVQ